MQVLIGLSPRVGACGTTRHPPTAKLTRERSRCSVSVRVGTDLVALQGAIDSGACDSGQVRQVARSSWTCNVRRSTCTRPATGGRSNAHRAPVWLSTDTCRPVAVDAGGGRPAIDQRVPAPCAEEHESTCRPPPGCRCSPRECRRRKPSPRPKLQGDLPGVPAVGAHALSRPRRLPQTRAGRRCSRAAHFGDGPFVSCPALGARRSMVARDDLAGRGVP